MRSLAGWWRLSGWGALLVVACSGSAGDLFSNGVGGSATAGFAGIAGRGGRGGLGGSVGRAGRGGESGLAGDPGGSGGSAGDAGGSAPDAGLACEDESTCDDRNDCTTDGCDDGICSHSPVVVGTGCGDNQVGDCKAAATCDGAGACVAGDEPNGSACEGGSCTLGECIEGAPVGCPAEVVATLPFQASWRTVGGVNLYDSVGCNDVTATPDFAVIFSAPAAATYCFEAAGLVGTDDPETPGDNDASELADSVLTVAAGACAGFDAPQLACQDDISQNNLDSRIQRMLAEGETVTVYAGEVRELGGGSGTLSISAGACD
jgi:hypothetical protein